MSDATLSAEDYAEYMKLKNNAAKQKRYQQLLNAKITLQSKWAKINGCPIDSKHAEFYLAVDEPLRESLNIHQIIDMASSWDKSDDATAHVVAMLNKKEGAVDPSLDDETEEEEHSA